MTRTAVLLFLQELASFSVQVCKHHTHNSQSYKSCLFLHKGIDLMDLAPNLTGNSGDVSRKGWQHLKFVSGLQESFNAIEKVSCFSAFTITYILNAFSLINCSVLNLSLLLFTQAALVEVGV